MNKNAYRGHRFPPAIIQVTVWMYARFTLSLLAQLIGERPDNAGPSRPPQAVDDCRRPDR